MLNELEVKYLYRRQYLLSPRKINSFRNWKEIQVSKNYFLATHPDLPVTIAHSQYRSIYLLGYIIDAYRPTFHDSQIIQDIIDNSISADDIFENIADKCGRFVIIVKFEGDIDLAFVKG